MSSYILIILLIHVNFSVKLPFHQNDFKFFLTPNDPYFDTPEDLNDQWNLDIINMREAWDLTINTPIVNKIGVCVVDSGYYVQSWDVPVILGKWNFVSDDNDISPNSDTDRGYHSTFVGGLVGGTRNNNNGIAGIVGNWASGYVGSSVSKASAAFYFAKISYKLFGWEMIKTSAVADAIRWCVDSASADNRKVVINVSLGTSINWGYIEDAVEYAYNNGALIVAAAGNTGENDIFYPAAYPEVIAVSSIDHQYNLASDSTYGSHIAFAASGVGIWSSGIGNEGSSMEFRSGTSFASPHVTALLALMWSMRPELSGSTIYNILKESVIDLGSTGKDIYYGYGLINAQLAIINTINYGSSSGGGSGGGGGGGGPLPTP